MIFLDNTTKRDAELHWSRKPDEQTNLLKRITKTNNLVETEVIKNSKLTTVGAKQSRGTTRALAWMQGNASKYGFRKGYLD